MKKTKKKSRVGLIILGLIALSFLWAWSFLIGFNSNQPGQDFNEGNNAIWIGHEWVGEQKTNSQVQALVEQLASHDFKTVFVHSGPLKEDGSLDPETYMYAADFLEKARMFNDEIQYQAWLGQIRSKIDLENPKIRHNVANEAMVLTTVVGFDGIHFDIEPVWDEDLHFIETLKESREMMEEDKKISVALAEFIPRALIWLAEEVKQFENFNSEVNYRNVAEYADQVVAMVYDTGIEEEWLYRWLVKEQTVWITRLLPDTEVFIGLPAYEDEKDGFNPEIENIENAMLGVIDGMNNTRSNEESFTGVAIYSYWTMDPEEFIIYRNLWIKE